uniref:Uncharacterized protein n=1 Tax=Arundo donax TaxID=35708 RepID=A0A0A9H008_ARUDO
MYASIIFALHGRVLRLCLRVQPS